MNLLTLINALLTLDIDISVKKAEALYNAMGLGSINSDLEYWKGEVERLRAKNVELSRTQDHALVALRSKLTGTTHDYLVETALASATIIDLVANNKKILAIKELREVAGCHLREARDAIDDARVQARAALAEGERDQLD